MAELTDADFEAASVRGDSELRVRPRAAAVRYDAAADRIVVDLTNGATFAFPPRLLQGLETASDAEIGAVELSPSGIGLHWSGRDADFTVAGLLAGWFGTRRYMAERFGADWAAAAA